MATAWLSSTPSLLSGAAITVVQPTRPQLVSIASVSGRAASGESCKALLDDRRKVNLENGYTFYTWTRSPKSISASPSWGRTLRSVTIGLTTAQPRKAWRLP